MSNSMLCRVAATRHGFDFEEGVLRPLPTKHRYLPPPDAGASSLSAGMREKAVLTFKRVAWFAALPAWTWNGYRRSVSAATKLSSNSPLLVSTIVPTPQRATNR